MRLTRTLHYWRPSISLLAVDGPKTNPFDIRRAHSDVYRSGMHSNLLSEHIVTQRAARDEEAWRRRKAQEYRERGMLPSGMAGDSAPPSKAQPVDHEAAPSKEEFWDIKTEQYAIVACAITGFLIGHVGVSTLLKEESVRLPYDPVQGFLHDVEIHEQRVQRLHSYVSTSVWDAVGKHRT